MIKLILSEFLKLKRSWIFICVTAGMAVSPFFVTMILLSNSNGNTTLLFERIFIQNHLFSIIIINLLIFNLLATFIINREYQENTISTILTIPVSRFEYLTSKILTIILMCSFLTLLSFLFCLIIGFIFNAEGLNFPLIIATLKYYFSGLLLLIPVIIANIWIAILSKNFVIPIALSIITVISNFFLLNSDIYSYFSPWTIPGILTLPSWDLNTDLVKSSKLLELIFSLVIITGTYVSFEKRNIQ